MSKSPATESSETPKQSAQDLADARLRWIYGSVLVSALLSFASFHPIDLGLLAYVALVPLLALAATETRRVGISAAFCATVLYHVVGLSWIALTAPEGWLLTSFLEGFYGVTLICLPIYVRRKTGLPLALTLPLLGAFLECIRGWYFPFIAFPWLLWGHTQHSWTTLIQIADIGSVYAVGFLVFSVNGAITDATLLVLARRKAEVDLSAADFKRLKRIVGIPVALIVLSLGYGVARLSHVESSLDRKGGPRLLVVQSDIPQSLTGPRTSAQGYAEQNLRLTRAGMLKSSEPVDVVLWSETMWPFPIEDGRTAAGRVGWNSWLDGYRKHEDRKFRAHGALINTLTQQLKTIATQAKAPLLVGAVDRGYDGGGEHNSYYMLEPRPHGKVEVTARYDKIQLVPASEYIPFKNSSSMGWFYRFFRNFVPPSFTVFDRGLMHDEEKTQRIFTVGNHKLAPNICFEVSFPELLRQGTAKGATVHVCPANDAWFVRGAPGRGISTAEIKLAQAHTKFRAIENRRSMVRCVNRGVSLVIDPMGETVSRIERIGPDGDPVTVGVAGTLVVRPPVSDLQSFYVRFGNVFPLGCGLVILVLCGLASKGRVLIG